MKKKSARNKSKQVKKVMRRKPLTNKSGHVRELKREDIHAMQSADKVLPEKLLNVLQAFRS